MHWTTPLNTSRPSVWVAQDQTANHCNEVRGYFYISKYFGASFALGCPSWLSLKLATTWPENSLYNEFTNIKLPQNTRRSVLLSETFWPYYRPSPKDIKAPPGFRQGMVGSLSPGASAQGFNTVQGKCKASSSWARGSSSVWRTGKEIKKDNMNSLRAKKKAALRPGAAREGMTFGNKIHHLPTELAE